MRKYMDLYGADIFYKTSMDLMTIDPVVVDINEKLDKIETKKSCIIFNKSC